MTDRYALNVVGGVLVAAASTWLLWWLTNRKERQ